jgi:hypothetical protein
MSESEFDVRYVSSIDDLIDVFSFFRKGVLPQSRVEELMSSYARRLGDGGFLLPAPLPRLLLFVRGEGEMMIGAASLELRHCAKHGMIGTIRFRTHPHDRKQRGPLRIALLVSAYENLRSLGAQTVILELDRVRDAGLSNHLKDAGFIPVDAGKRYQYHRRLEDME